MGLCLFYKLLIPSKKTIINKQKILSNNTMLNIPLFPLNQFAEFLDINTKNEPLKRV